MKHALVLLLACLLMPTLALDSSAAPAEVLHVGGFGSGNYTSLEMAVAAAAPGDHVIVHPGSYPGLTVDKPLTLEGRRAVLPSIDITAGNVTVTGFIVNGGTHGVSIQDSHVTVSNCSVLNHTYGITVEADHARITDNHIYKNAYYGLWLRHCEDTVIDRNRIYRNQEGIYSHRSDGGVITNNSIENNSVGVHLESTTGTVVSRNDIVDSRKRGLYFCCESEGNLIYRNIFIRNDQNAWGYNGANTWDDGGTGNYWDDHNGSGAYVIDDDNVDCHPLRQPVTVPSLPDAIYILSPPPGQTMSGTVVIRGVSEQARPVEIRVDNGSWSRAQGNLVWHMSLDTTSLADGNHTIQARCGDATATTTMYIENEDTDSMPAAAPVAILAALSLAFMFHRHRPGSRGRQD
ncbi:MAG: NosD domain-containing protein [Thermoplasmatota archaeon]